MLATMLSVLSAAPDVQAQVDRTSPPALGPMPALDLPHVQRFTLGNGLPVVLMEKHQVPLVQMTLLVKVGTVNDPPSKNGLAEMTLDMMDEGAGARDALALADAIDFLGASLSTEAYLHHSTVELFTPLSKLDAALPLMADVVLRPTFPEVDLERLRLEWLTYLISVHDYPDAIATTAFNRTLYGTEHPYGAPAGGMLEASFKSFTRSDVQHFHNTYFHPNNATLIVVGDVIPEQVRSKLEAAFGDWQAGESSVVNMTEAEQVRGRTLYLVDKPESEQSVISIGRIGAPRDSEDYYTLMVLNTALGGSFTSRLNQNLREDKGYAYHANSSFDFRPVAGPFTASAAVQTDATGAALTEFMKELRGILETLPQEELERAKNYEALQFAQRFQTVEQVAAQLADFVIYDLPEDYFIHYQEHIMAVTQADVHEAARRYIDPDNLAIIVVGDRKVIEEQVRALDLGPIRFLSVKDVLGKIPVLPEDSK